VKHLGEDRQFYDIVITLKGLMWPGNRFNLNYDT